MLFYPERFMQRQCVAGRIAFAVRSNDRDLAQAFQTLCKQMKSLGMDPIVIRYQDPHVLALTILLKKTDVNNSTK